MKIEFVKDKFRKVRGNYSRILKLTCRKCGAFVFYYQKDGPGNLRRCYFDRIVQYKRNDYGEKYVLLCAKSHELGMVSDYVKENRPVYLLFTDAVEKEVVSIKDF